MCVCVCVCVWKTLFITYAKNIYNIQFAHLYELDCFGDVVEI